LSFYLAGVVPVAGQKLDFDMPWHDALMPISKGYAAVERAVAECATVGCETIWVVCNDDIAPLIKHVLGESVQDPLWVHRKNPAEQGRNIPIFYVPINASDRRKRDSLGWSVIQGAMTARNVGTKISTWTRPDRYYVSFPYGVYPIDFLYHLRKKISHKDGFHVSFNGKTIKDNKFLGFTFNDKELKRMRHRVFTNGTGRATGDPMKGTRKELPLEEKWSARFFSLDKIFENVTLNANVELENEPLWYYGIDNWEDYALYLGSGESNMIEKPSILAYKEFNPIGRDNV